MIEAVAFASPPGGPGWLFGLALALALAAEMLARRYGL